MFEEMMPVGLKGFFGGVKDVIDTVEHVFESVQRASENGADEITVHLDDGLVVSRCGDEFLYDMPPQKIVLPVSEEKNSIKWFLKLDVWGNIWKALAGGADEVTIDDDGTVIALFNEGFLTLYDMPALNFVGSRLGEPADRSAKSLLKGRLFVRASAN